MRCDDLDFNRGVHYIAILFRTSIRICMRAHIHSVFFGVMKPTDDSDVSGRDATQSLMLSTRSRIPSTLPIQSRKSFAGEETSLKVPSPDDMLAGISACLTLKSDVSDDVPSPRVDATTTVVSGIPVDRQDDSARGVAQGAADLTSQSIDADDGGSIPDHSQDDNGILDHNLESPMAVNADDDHHDNFEEEGMEEKEEAQEGEVEETVVDVKEDGEEEDHPSALSHSGDAPSHVSAAQSREQVPILDTPSESVGTLQAPHSSERHMRVSQRSPMATPSDPSSRSSSFAPSLVVSRSPTPPTRDPGLATPPHADPTSTRTITTTTTASTDIVVDSVTTSFPAGDMVADDGNTATDDPVGTALGTASPIVATPAVAPTAARTLTSTDISDGIDVDSVARSPSTETVALAIPNDPSTETVALAIPKGGTVADASAHDGSIESTLRVDTDDVRTVKRPRVECPDGEGGKLLVTLPGMRTAPSPVGVSQ